MIIEEMIFIGKSNMSYVFSNQNEKKVVFNRLRTDLIHEYHLNQDLNIGKRFKVTFFYSTNGGIDTPILSNLELITA